MVWRAVILISSFPRNAPTGILNRAGARMPLLFCDGAAMLTMRAAVVLGVFWIVSASPARADDALCAVTGVNMVTPDQGTVSIDCSGVSEAFGRQFADLLTRILKDRLDPQTVMAKLDEVDRVPEEGVARTVSDDQRQLIIQSLHGKPPGQIAITAHPVVDDSAEFAKAIATPLLQVGWQIVGQQIRRAAPQSLEAVPGLAVVVHDQAAPPQQALQLRAALRAAHIAAALIADPAVAPDATLLWVGQRPSFTPTEPK
jgi:hypothetical protein